MKKKYTNQRVTISYQKESPITSHNYMFSSFYYRGQSIWKTVWKGQPNGTKGTHEQYVHLNLAPNNLITLTLRDNSQHQSPHFVVLLFHHFQHVCSQRRFKIESSYRRFTSYTTFSQPKSALLFSPSNSFLQFQLVCCWYANDRWSNLPVYPTEGCTQPFIIIYWQHI